MSGIATTPAALQRFASGFGRFAAVLSACGLVAALCLSVPSSWLDALAGSGHHETPAYRDLRAAAPVRLAVGGVAGVQLMAPLVESTVPPRRSLAEPPADAPLVGWWSGSAKAGAPHGQTILLAHTGPRGGGLTQLAGLDQGDLVDLLTRQGTMRYQVRSIRTFDPAAMERAGITLFKQDGGAGRLVMVSAEAWDGAHLPTRRRGHRRTAGRTGRLTTERRPRNNGRGTTGLRRALHQPWRPPRPWTQRGRPTGRCW